MDRKVKGLTVVELLVVTVIIAILMSFAYRWVLVLVANQRLKNAQDQLVSHMENAKLRSLTTNAPWGLHIDSSSYVVFSDLNRNCQFDQGENTETVDMPSGISASASRNTFVFNRRGMVRGGTGCELIGLKIVLENTFGTRRVITIEPYGRIRSELQ